MSDRPLAEVLEECTERCRSMDGPLAVRLQSFANDVRAHNHEFADVVERMISRLQLAGAGTEAPGPGDPMPDFALPDHTGRLVLLSDLIATGPVAIAFHRGHWCPYCRINASALAGIYGDIKLAGGKLVAITPEMEKFNAELRTKAHADFPVLSDMDNGYALMLNLAFYVGDEKQQFMKAAGWDISPFQGNTHWTLPIPATFVVNRDGLVCARFIDPDYRKRMKIDELLTAIHAAR